MTDRKEVISEVGKREADGSVRFAAHPAGVPFDGLMEPIHNMLTYGKSKGRVEIIPRGSKICDYKFYNNAKSEMLPTYERLKIISEKAGSSISASKGVSLCGVGTEVAALSCRSYSDSTVTAHINIVRDGYSYGSILTFNGSTKEISYEMICPKESKAENSYEVTFKDCKKLTDKEIKSWKTKIADTMYGKNFEIIFSYEYDVCKIIPCDFLYRDKLRGTSNYEEHIFTLVNENGIREELKLELSDISSVIKNGEGNIYEDTTQYSPELSGGAYRYQNIATVCRDDISWKVSGAYKKGHPTRNNIRFDITIGKFIFTELHKESQVKTKTSIVLSDIKGKYRDELKIYDEAGNEYPISEIEERISNFVNMHKTDSNAVENITKMANTFKNALSDNNITNEDINSTIKTLKLVDVRMNALTLLNEVLVNLNN